MSEARSILDELLDDPMTRLVMARDSVDPEELRFLLEQAVRPAVARTDVDEADLPPAHVIAESCCANWFCA